MSYWAEKVPEQEDSGDVLVWCSDDSHTIDSSIFGAKLMEQECSQLQSLLSKFKSTLLSRPERTNLAEHSIPVESS